MMKHMFFGIGAIVIFAIGIGIAFVFAKGFQMGASGMHIMLAVGALAPLIFFASIMMGRALPATGLTNTLYTATMTLGGMVFYLFAGAIALGVILIITAIAKQTLPLWVPWVILIASIALGVIGLVQARTATVRHYSVSIPDLPAVWHDKTAVLVSDTHFGQINNDRFAKRVVDRILALDPDLVLHAGDFYDGIAIETAGIGAEFARLAKAIPVFYAPGNHEEYGGAYETFIKSVADAGVTVLADSSTVYDGVQIAGITYRGPGQATGMVAVFEALDISPDLPAILINHPPTFQSQAAAVGIGLMVSGHTHNGQFWPLNHIIRAIYGKYAHGVAVDPGIITVTTSGIGTWGPPFRLFNTPELVVLEFRNQE